jgi:L-fuculose-phosphate aldolase/L-ribulose-5-phosphate 4-epimerase
MLLENLRRKVLETANILPQFELVWMAGGTICARDPETQYVVVTPSGLSYQSLTPEDMIVTDMDMNPIEGAHRPSVALNLWTGFMRARPDIHAVVHTHSPYATAFSVVDEAIPVITETMANWFGAPVPVTPYLSIDDPLFASLPIEVLGDGFGVLLGQHGPITVGETLEDALERAVTLEEVSRTYMIAKTIGNPNTLTPEQSSRSFNYYHESYGQPSQELS